MAAVTGSGQAGSNTGPYTQRGAARLQKRPDPGMPVGSRGPVFRGNVRRTAIPNILDILDLSLRHTTAIAVRQPRPQRVEGDRR